MVKGWLSRKLELTKKGLWDLSMDWQGLTIEREIHLLILQEGTAEINHYWQEIHGNYIPSRLPMGLCKSPATPVMCCQSILRSSGSKGSKENLHRDNSKSASTQQMYACPQRRRCQWAHRRSPDGDHDPSDSDWDSVFMISEASSVNSRQRGDGNLWSQGGQDDSTEEAC